MIKTILRWVATPIAASAVALIVYILGTLYVEHLLEEDVRLTGAPVIDPTHILILIAVLWLYGYFFVRIASLVAPSYKKKCAVVAAIIMIVLQLVSMSYMFMSDGYSWLDIVSAVLPIVGAINSVKSVEE